MNTISSILSCGIRHRASHRDPHRKEDSERPYKKQRAVCYQTITALRLLSPLTAAKAVPHHGYLVELALVLLDQAVDGFLRTFFPLNSLLRVQLLKPDVAHEVLFVAEAVLYTNSKQTGGYEGNDERTQYEATRAKG